MSDNYTATFGSFNLKGTDYHITKIDVGPAKMRVDKYELARADGQVVTNQNYGERKITIEGKINATSLDDMTTKLDTLKYNLTGIDQDLDIYFDSNLRRYKATVENFTYNIKGYYCEYEIAFTADSLGKATSATALTFGTYTTNNTAYANTIVGSYKVKPSLDFTLTYAIPHWSAKYLQFYYPNGDERMRFTRVWGWFDRVVVNGETKSVSIYPTTVTELFDCDSITGWTSAHTLSLETTNMIEGTGAFKVVMASAAASSYVQALNTTSSDLSSTSGKIILPIFIPTPTSGTIASVSLQIGSDTTLTTNNVTYTETTQYDGSAIASNAWNYILIDLSTSPDATSGTAVRTAIISYKITLNATATAQLNGWLVDYISLQKASIVSEPLDYEGTFLDLEPGSQSITVSDEFTVRSMVLTGEYTKKYL